MKSLKETLFNCIFFFLPDANSKKIDTVASTNYRQKFTKRPAQILEDLNNKLKMRS